MRLFIALDLVGIDGCASRLKDGLKRHGVASATGTHLTLKFLGEVDEKTIDVIVGKLTAVDFSSFSLTTSRIGFFPDEKRPRVVWLGIEACPELMRLQQDIEEALVGLGFKKDFSFHPHITLARIKFLDDRAGFLETIKSLPIEKKTVDVMSFALIESVLMPTGPVYDVVTEFF
ncbi:MAG: RNA 2',3'-cyclic phosphodiesterase [archaeon]